MSFELLTILKRLQILKQEWQKSSAGTMQTDGKNMVWFGVIERKLAKLSKTILLLTVLHLNYFMFYPLFSSVMVAIRRLQEIQLWLYQDGLRQHNGCERCPLAAGCGLTLLNPEWPPIPLPLPLPASIYL